MERVFETLHSYLEVVSSPKAIGLGCETLFPKPHFEQPTFLSAGWKGCLWPKSLVFVSALTYLA